MVNAAGNVRSSEVEAAGNADTGEMKMGTVSEGWISCDERLPEIDEPVLAWVEGTLCSLVRFDDGDGWLWAMCDGWPFRKENGEWECDSNCDDEYLPTHWMPLPERPIRSNEETASTSGVELNQAQVG